MTQDTDTHYPDEIKIVLFGNAILDVGKRLFTDDIHRKFGLKCDDQLELEAETMAAIQKDLAHIPGDSYVTSGGSCLNTTKILSQLGERRAIFCGGIGRDENGRILQQILDKGNIRRRLQEFESYPTAHCICLIHKESRCLVAHIGASLHFNCLEIIEELASCRPAPPYCYIEGYFVPHKMNLCKRIFSQFCEKQNSELVINLNATYIVQLHSAEILWLFHRAALVFGNRREFEALLNAAGAASIAELLKQSPGTEQVSSKRICVITDGPRSVTYVEISGSGGAGGVKEESVLVPKVSENLVLDTTGAGDAFVAGFLQQYMSAAEAGESLIVECIRNGVQVAQRKLAYLGCTIIG